MWLKLGAWKREVLLGFLPVSHKGLKMQHNSTLRHLASTQEVGGRHRSVQTEREGLQAANGEGHPFGWGGLPGAPQIAPGNALCFEM